jgi:hypothetical protein
VSLPRKSSPLYQLSLLWNTKLLFHRGGLASVPSPAAEWSTLKPQLAVPFTIMQVSVGHRLLKMSFTNQHRNRNQSVVPTVFV